MNNQPFKTLLFYSKYSEKCRDAMSVLQDVEYIEKVCIDTEAVRKSITNSTNLQIQYVPCLLVIYANGQVEKLDGHQFSDWLQAMIRENIQVEERIEGTGRKPINIRSEINGRSEQKSQIMREHSQLLPQREEDIKNENGLVGTGLEKKENDISRKASQLAKEREALVPQKD